MCRALFLPIVLVALLQQTSLPPTPLPVQTDPSSRQEGANAAPVHIGGDVKAPVLIHDVVPQFSAAARAEHKSGNVKIYLWVTTEGLPSHVRVVQGVGYGLDEEAVKAVQQYRFKPATRNGEPVTVDIYIDVNFQFRDR